MPMLRRTATGSTVTPYSQNALIQARLCASLLSTSVPSTSKSTAVTRFCMLPEMQQDGHCPTRRVAESDNERSAAADSSAQVVRARIFRDEFTQFVRRDAVRSAVVQLRGEERPAFVK